MLCRLGGVRGQPTRPGDGLVERGVDATVRGDLGDEALAVGRPELLDLSVAQQVLDDRVLVAQLLERRLVGRVAGLGLLAGCETELVEQDRSHLRRGVDVEVLPRRLDDRGPLGLGLGGEGVVEAAEHVDVDRDAEVLHLGEHPDQRHLDVVVEAGQPVRLERLRQGLDELRHRQGVPTGDLRDRRAAPVEVELALRGGPVVRELELGVAAQQLGQAVERARRVEQVGGQLGVEVQTGHVGTHVEQGPHERLGVVDRDLRGAAEHAAAARRSGRPAGRPGSRRPRRPRRRSPRPGRRGRCVRAHRPSCRRRRRSRARPAQRARRPPRHGCRRR